MSDRPRSGVRPGETSRLFQRHELFRVPSIHTRLQELARRAPPPSELDRRQEDDRRTMEQLRGWGADLARRFGLRYKAIDPEREGVTEHYGICYEDGLILIRLRHATTGRLLKESSLVDTLCHELAHLEHLDHSSRFRRLYRKILDAARQLGYYRPGPVENTGPRQLPLFDDGACGLAAAAKRTRRLSKKR